MARDLDPTPLKHVLLAGLLGLAATGCGDSPLCVFSGTCFDSGTVGALGATAVRPVNGEFISDAAPRLVNAYPDATNVHPRSPLVLVFSESLDPDSLGGGLGGILGGGTQPFSLINLFAGGFGGGTVPYDLELFADGRVVVLLPVEELELGDHVLRINDTADIEDLTGQDLTTSGDVLTFGVGETPPSDLQLVATWPEDGSDGQGTRAEILAFFDRPVDPDTMTGDAWQVTVDMDPPAIDPDPLPFTESVPLLPDVVDNRIWSWTSVDPVSGEVASFGTGVPVELRLSPTDARITVTGDDPAELELQEIGFDTADFDAPLSASIRSEPTDAIGVPNLETDGVRPLEIEVVLDGAAEGDQLDVFLFGTTHGDEPRLVALRRSQTLTADDVAAAIVSRETLDLVDTDDPFMARFADGDVTMAFRLSRGSVESPVTLLDVDPDTDGVQDALLDTRAPSAGGVGDGEIATFRSDLRGLALTGTSDEDVFAVEVTTTNPTDSNDILAAALGTAVVDDAWLYVAEPVDLGVAAGDVDYQFTLYDRALNPAPAQVGVFTQLGGVGPDPHVAGSPIDVSVFDVASLEPLSGAAVFVLGPDGGGGFELVDSDVTDAEGRVSQIGTGADPAILIVDYAGYDLFGFQGVTASRVSVPLSSTSLAEAGVAGSLAALGTDVASYLNTDPSRVVGFTRRTSADFPVADADSMACASDGFLCQYPTVSVRAGRLGAASYLAGDFGLAANNFNAQNALQLFEWIFPLPALEPGDAGAANFTTRRWLALADAAERAYEGPEVVLLGGVAGLDEGQLVGDDSFAGLPIVSVEAVSPGLHGTLPVGVGFAYADGADWNLRTAVPGDVGIGGAITLTGALEEDLLLRAELRDVDGNRSARRPTFAQVEAGSGSLALPAVSQVTDPGPGGSVFGNPFDLVFDDVLTDAEGQPGIYEVELTLPGGRRWVLYLPDPSDGTGTSVHVPDGLAGLAIPDGDVDCVVTAMGYESLTLSSFLWSDLERRYDQFSRSAAIRFSKEDGGGVGSPASKQ